MPDISITFEDGGVERLASGTTAADALLTHAERLGTGKKTVRRAVAAFVSDAAGRRLVDLSHALEADAAIGPIAADSDEGLEVIRHSCAHLMAQAVQRLFPGTQITIGPVIQHGFYYDFRREEPFTPEDLEKIESAMTAIVSENLRVEREVWDRDRAIEHFRGIGEHYKAEIIEGLSDAVVSVYRQGEFLDLCRGPHLPETGRMGAFKLTHVAGAYWRGDARNEQLQRIYGTAWATPKDLAAHLRRLEEAKERDHRRIGQALDLFSIHPIAPGSPFFHPRGAVIYNRLVDYVRGLYARYGYTEVITPLVYRTDLWKTSGHYEAFRDDMFLMQMDDDEYGVKPMNCPGHCYLFATRKHSYRDLPVRFADFSRLHRFEPSGTLTGLTRVRSMAQDDAHIYCTAEQLDDELASFIAMTREVYDAFGFERVDVTLQTRPERFLGRVELWDAAEAALARAAEAGGYPVTELPGEGAFYGPKLGFDFRDVLDRSWTLATVQIDCAMPERFGLGYVGPDGAEAVPMMLHRAVLGSIERFIAILLEHTAGRLPLWLAPEQVRILPVSEKVAEYGARVAASARSHGLRAECDLRNEKLGYKVRAAEMQKVPAVVVVGEREAAAETVAPRLGPGEGEVLALEAYVTQVVAAAQVPGGAS